MDLKNYLEEKKSFFDKKLLHLIEKISEGLPEVLYKSIKYSIEAGGKRLRPILTLATAEALDGNIEDASIIGCAIEFIHTYSLIHDDLPAMDDDDFRRGKPTNHKVFGEAIAILAGDALLTDAFFILSNKNFFKNTDTTKLLKIINFIAKSAGSSGMVAGQVLDLVYEKKDVDETIVRNIHINKTSKLITASVYSGAVISTDDELVLNKFINFGRKIGLAFQIVDDILDLTSDLKTLGKDAKSDIQKDKATYPKVVGIEKSKKIANNLIKEAIDEISFLKDRAIVLKSLAEYFIQRVN